jgi:hypothetical protein
MSKEIHNDSAGAPETRAETPLAELTSLVLDAADAANDSAQSTHEAIARLTQVVEANERTAKAVRNAPAIFGAIMLGVGIALAVVVAIVFANMQKRADSLAQVIAKQTAGVESIERTLKDLKLLEGNLARFETIAADTTQRAVVTLREQVRTDRLALQQLEVRRLNEMLDSLRGAVSTAAKSPRPSATEAMVANTELKQQGLKLDVVDAAIRRLDTRLANMEKQLPREGQASTPERSKQRIVAVLSEEQGKDIKAATAEVTKLKSEITALRDLIERRTSELQSGVPVVRKP